MFGRKQKEIDSLKTRVCQLEAKLSFYEQAEGRLNDAYKRLDRSCNDLYNASDSANEFKNDLLTQYEAMFLRWKEGMAELMFLKDVLKQGVYAVSEQPAIKKSRTAAR